MPDSELNPPSERLQSGAMATTHWSAVVAAGGGSSEQSAKALQQLCRTYWYPLYAYVRRKGYDEHDAKDLTQAFFLKLLEKGIVGMADRKRGRFRSGIRINSWS